MHLQIHSPSLDHVRYYLKKNKTKTNSHDKAQNLQWVELEKVKFSEITKARETTITCSLSAEAPSPADGSIHPGASAETRENTLFWCV